MAKHKDDDGGSLFPKEAAQAQEPVECLSMTFPNDEERRKHFLEKLREKLKDPEFRKIEGFPIGADEDILALSDPPYYTACPNPFIADFIKQYGKPYDPSKPYSREPFAADVTEGKRDPFYEHYSYHTKVPHKAIARYIAHYTSPGEIVFDAFSGSGMTGLAAKYLGSQADKSYPNAGERHAILNDLSTYASYIGHHYNHLPRPCDLSKDFQNAADTFSWMYKTRDYKGVERMINYVVWSDVFLCHECGSEVVFFDNFVNSNSGEVKSSSKCSVCNAHITKTSLQSCWVTTYDDLLGTTARVLKQVPVLVRYYVGSSQNEKKPDDSDLSLIKKIQQTPIPAWIPIQKLPEGDNTTQPIRSHGITHSHMFFTRRNLIAFSTLWNVASENGSTFWMFELLGGFRVWTRRSIFLTKAWKQGGTGAFKPSTTGILYIPSISGERNVFNSFRERQGKALSFASALPKSRTPSLSSCSSSGDLKMIPNNSIDYVFVDPPFGGNLMYSELNLVYEPWLRVLTASKHEAICNKVMKKDALAYTAEMTKCFSEINRVLKPGRWLTVEFHNSKNVIWNSIQESLQHGGFVVADVRTLDKKQGTFKQYTTAGAVKQDLVISAYKPNDGLEDRFKLEAGTEEGVWDFVRTHMKQLPRFVSKDGQAEVIAERQNFLLYDRMVAFHVQRGVTIPLSAAEFYAGLAMRLSERDGMYFLPEQVAEYDKKRMTVRDMLQLELFVTDESSSIQWLRQQLIKKPQTFQELHPQFLKEISGWQKHEKPLELSELLEQNFLRYDGNGEVPNQIHSYLSTNFKELRKLPKGNESLRTKGKDRWYVPDHNKAGDLEKLRERSLLKEFEEYRSSTQKRLKVFRLEAVRTGFKKAWQERDYATIITVARKIPENVLQEDPNLLMWYDQAITRTGDIS
ncbi:MAG TPA: DNA methylase [Nitrospiraceae bacterium]|nr:DNA methylase [Nitrospiraceae bacterium]